MRLPWIFVLACVGIYYRYVILAPVAFLSLDAWDYIATGWHSLLAYWLLASVLRWTWGRLAFRVKYATASTQVKQMISTGMGGAPGAEGASLASDGAQYLLGWGQGPALILGFGILGVADWWQRRNMSPEQRANVDAARAIVAERGMWVLFSGYLGLACIGVWLVATW